MQGRDATCSPGLEYRKKWNGGKDGVSWAVRVPSSPPVSFSSSSRIEYPVERARAASSESLGISPQLPLQSH